MQKRYLPTLILAVALFSGLFMATGALADPPSQSGPIVFRYEINWGWAYVASGLIAVHGFDDVHWCNLGCPGDPACFDTDELNKLKEIVSPAEADLIMQLWKGDDLTTTVWPWEGSLCGSVDALQQVPLAFGTVDLIATDNDLFASAVHNRMNSFKISAHGALETPAGERLQFMGRNKCVWHPIRQPIKCTNKINLK